MAENRRGIIYLRNEEPAVTVGKYVSWLAIVLVVVLVVIWFNRVVYQRSCNLDYADYVAKQIKQKPDQNWYADEDIPLD